ncbi:MAG: hypothetical protein PW786_04125 [Arachidicoccus sp.]|nr:hypothetical protein [Arachidicoccus sp.]
MKKYFLFILLFPAWCFAQDNAAPIIHYNIYATLSSSDKTITGFEKIIYKNTSDTPQSFLWLRLIPNAYANDKTAYSDYLLRAGDTRFYFSKEEQKGYIDQFDFKQNDISLKMEFDSAKNDIIKVFLSNPLLPGDSAEITTPFFVKIPYDFSGFGYNDDDNIELTHWFPEVVSHQHVNSFTSYQSLRNEHTDFDVRITLDRNDFRSNANILNKSTQDNKTVIDYHLSNAEDFILSEIPEDNSEDNVAKNAEEKFDQLIPNFLSNKRPDDPQTTAYFINQKINSIDSPLHKTLQPAFLFNLKETDKYNYLSFLPAFGYNNYDKFMVGAMIHNYQLPLNKFNFLLAPMYATNSKSLAGAARMEYNIWKPKGWWKFAVSGEQYSTGELVSSEFVNTEDQKNLYYQMRRIVPSISYTKYYGADEPDKKWNFLLRAFFLKEENYDTKNITDSTYSFYKKSANSTIVEFQTTFSNERVLYPYKINFKVDGNNDFLRFGLTANGFLNYDASGKGLNVRFFAGKFFYMNNGAHYGLKNADMQKYTLSLSGTRGNTNAYQPADFTYSNYFIGRSESTGWMSQQIAENDGFFKISTPAEYAPVGSSDNWLAALNFTADIPDKINPFSILPFKMPLRVFLDVGTYSAAWADDYSAPSGKYLYDAGLQVSLLRDALTVYFPLLYSNVYKDDYPVKRFVHTIRFSINLENLKPKALGKILPL